MVSSMDGHANPSGDKAAGSTGRWSITTCLHLKIKTVIKTYFPRRALQMKARNASKASVGSQTCWRFLLRQELKMDVLRILLAIILPPLGVFLQVGIGLHFWINILLTLLGYVPGIIHAIWVIIKK